MLKFISNKKGYYILDVICLAFQSHNERVKQKLNEAMSAAEKLSCNPTVDKQIGNGKIFNRSITLKERYCCFVSRVPSAWTLKLSFTVYCFNSTQRQAQSVLRTVPTIVTAHTFCASPDTRNSYRQCLLIQGYFCAV